MYKYLLYFFISLLHVNIFSQSVENVRFEQQGKQIVIYYDLISEGYKGNFSVNVYYTLDYGKTYLPVKTVTGDAGVNISAGRQKKIVWNVLDDVSELTGDIKFKVTAERKGKYTFWDYDVFASVRTLGNYMPYGGRIGLLGPNRIGGYACVIYGVHNTLQLDKLVVVGGPILNIAKPGKFRFSIFAGAGYYEEYDWSYLYGSDENFTNGFLTEGGLIFNYNHINLTLGVEFSEEIVPFAGIGFTL